MLELSDLTVKYGTGPSQLTAVDGVSLTVPRGGTLGLVGESGSGKSTLGRAVVGLLPLAGGTMALDGDDCSATKARNAVAFRRRVQMVFQDPHASLNPRMAVGTLMQEALTLRQRQRGREARQEARRILDLVGLPANALARYPHEFSGGQRQRVAIARALAIQPEVIVMDEVTSALDVSVQATILNLLRDLQQQFQLAYLFISHDLSVIGAMSEAVAVMYLGRIVEQGPREAIFANPRHPYTRALLESVPRFGQPPAAAVVSGDLPDPRKPPRGCRFHTRCPVGPLARPERQVCLERDPQAIAARQPQRAACHFAAESSPSDAQLLRGA